MDMTFPIRQLARLIGAIALALSISVLIAPLVAADFPGSRSGNCPNCPVNSRFFGYYPTLWRRWPGTEPQPQPAPTPPPETGTIPPVEPPPPADEIKNENKPMGAESSGGATPSTTTPTRQPPPNSGTGARPEESGAKRPVASPPAQDTLPAPLESPSKLNQLPMPGGPPGNCPTIEARLDQELPWGSQGAAWPPANILRHEEIRANVEFPDRSAHSDTGTMASPARAAFPSPKVASDRSAERTWDQCPIADSCPQTARSGAAAGERAIKCQSASSATEEPPGSAHHHLHWIDPPTAKNDQSQTDEKMPKRFESSDDAALKKSTSPNSSAPIDALRTAAGNRLPFVPSNSLCHALPPIDPQAPETRGDYRGAKPAEAASFRLAPPNKITEISVPTFAGGQANDRLPPPETLSGSNVTKIDPLAIGKSLDVTAPMAGHVASNKGKEKHEFAPFPEMVNPQAAATPSQSAIGSRFSGYLETTTGAVSSQHVPDSARQWPVATIPSPSGRATSASARIVSDDRSMAQDRVEQATFYGAPSPQRPAVQPNPLRNGAAAGEAISTDSPTGSVNPLR